MENTEYDGLREEIIATAAGYTDDVKALTTRLMTIIAEMCWLKDEDKKAPENPYVPPVKKGAYYRAVGWDKCWIAYHNAGWRPVIEIKKETK